MRKIPIARTLKRRWIPLVFVLVLPVSGLLVARLHRIFASADLNPFAGAGIDIVQFNPKYIGYEVFGPPGSTADINYWDAEANVHQVNRAPLPWSYTVVTVLPAVSANILAQGDRGQIGCRIKIDDELRDERYFNGTNAQTFCLVKSG
jgi:hypothetical protein